MTFSPRLSEREALAWIRERQEVRRSIRSIARIRRWPKSTVWRSLRDWEARGFLDLTIRTDCTIIRWRTKSKARSASVAPSPSVPLMVKFTVTDRPNGLIRIAGQIGTRDVVLTGPEHEILSELTAAITNPRRRSISARVA